MFLFIAVVLSSCGNNEEERLRIDLQGDWQFRLDEDNKGLEENYALKEFSETVILPGTTDTNKKGILNTKEDETSHLFRIYKYVGKAWYKKEINIPSSWNKKNITLTLERTKPTQLWIDGMLAGKNDNISTAQKYDLTDFLSPGKHTVTIMVDNGESVPKQLLSNSHAYTEAAQTNWNGIIGEMYLEAKNKLYIDDIQVTPDASKRTVRVKVTMANAGLVTDDTQLELSAKAWNTDKKHKVKSKLFSLKKGKSQYEFEYDLGNDALLWSEFAPVLYALDVKINGQDRQTVNFGLRDFKAEGTQFTINGQLTFLRGKHDACVFPLTAHTPMDVKSWRLYFQVCKEYGINHVRFHSWCPPKACFEAADIEGIYLQPELPFWGRLIRAEEYLVQFLMKEGINIQNEYGNHASFVLFALGNELTGDLDLMEEFTNKFREVDDRHLYAFGSNNFLGYKGQLKGEDFLVTCRIGGVYEDYSTHTRASFSFPDAPQGGYINNTYPNSKMDFSRAIAACTLPVIGHETGQFQTYPDYGEIEKYTGVLTPANIKIFRGRLEKAGMLDQAGDFFKASGRWSALLYKADVEMNLRTEGFAGFQLLDLQDYPGQGSAYVGILNAFMENKGHISAEEWKEFCNDVVPLFVTDKFCWTNKETLSGNIKIANYSSGSLDNKTVNWALKNKAGESIDKGMLTVEKISAGLIDIGIIKPDISSVDKAAELVLEIGISSTPYKNSCSLWVYPDSEVRAPEKNIYISRKLDNRMLSELNNGGSVLWFPDKEEYKQQTLEGLFQTDYWNYRMFKGVSERRNKLSLSPGTLGIFTSSEHPVFKDFPTDYHSNWQWYPIIKQSYPLIMDKMPEGYKPIVQVIDNVERNHRLGLLFEFKIGRGKLLVCMSDLDAVTDKPETRQLYNSILGYMASEEFNPTYQLSPESLKELFTQDIEDKEIKEEKNISYETNI